MSVVKKAVLAAGKVWQADSQKIVWLTLAAFVLSLAAYWVVLAVWPSFHARCLQGEDRLVEWLTFAAFLLAAVSGAAVLGHFRRMPPPARAYLAFLALFFLVCAGEEISWGQRILGFETPPMVREVNEQGEFNLHNLKLQHVHPKDVFSIFMKLFGILLPLALYKWNREESSPLRRYLPPPRMALCFLVPELIDLVADGIEEMQPAFVPGRFLKVIAGQNEELQEMYWAFCGLVSLFLIRRAWGRVAAGRMRA